MFIEPGISAQFLPQRTESDAIPTAESRQKRRRARRHLAPYVVMAGLASIGGAAAAGVFSGSKEKDPVPSLGAVLAGADGLNKGTPTLDEEQIRKWPARETVTATADQARDGLSAIGAAIDPEVYSGAQSNDATREALEAQLRSQTTNGFIRTGDSFDVANIHPAQANAITGGNTDIPAK